MSVASGRALTASLLRVLRSMSIHLQSAKRVSAKGADEHLDSVAGRSPRFCSENRQASLFICKALTASLLRELKSISMHLHKAL